MGELGKGWRKCRCVTWLRGDHDVTEYSRMSINVNLLKFPSIPNLKQGEGEASLLRSLVNAVRCGFE